MFGIGMPELLLIAVIALLVVGPKRLPDLAKSLGKGLAEFRKATEGATETIKESLRVDELRDEFRQDADHIKESLKFDERKDLFRQPPPPPSGNSQEAFPAPAEPAPVPPKSNDTGHTA